MKWTAFLFALFLLASCKTDYYIVRHAERLNNSDTTSLSDAGFIRAGALKDLLINKGIDSIVASNRKRTQQTAKPLATALGKTLRLYDPDTTNLLITALKKISNRQVLVVGHSDNVPVIVQGLSGRSISPIGATDFDNLYIVRVKKFFGTRRYLTSTTYGAPSP